MSPTLQETVEKLGLENPKVYVGRERLYPVRAGLTPSPRAIAAFEQALSSPESLKSSVKIMDGEQVVFKSAKGQVEVPLNISEQAKSAILAKALPQQVSEPQLAVEAKPEPQRVTEEKPEPLNVQAAEVESKTPQETQLDNNLQAPVEQLAIPEFVPAAEQPQAEKDNEAARATYLELLKQHPNSPDPDITSDQLSKQSVVDAMLRDRYVSEMAFEKGLSREELDRVIAQGSPYVRHQLESGSLTNAKEYLTQISTGYHDKLQGVVLDPALQQQRESRVLEATIEAQQKTAAARETYFDLLKQNPDFGAWRIETYEELQSQSGPAQRVFDDQMSKVALEQQLPHKEWESVMAQGSPYIQSEVESGSLSTAQDYMSERSIYYQHRLEGQSALQEQVTSNFEVASPTATTPAPAKQFDYPTAAHSIDPAKDFRDTVQRGAATLQTHAVSAKENIELAQKNLATFAKTVKHRGFKAWAADQMPILKQKALEIAAEQGAKLKDWAKEQAPVMKEAAIHTAQFVAQQAFEKGSVAAVVAGQVGRVVADKAFEKGKGFGAVAWEKFEKATQLVDPDKLDPAIKDAIALFGKDGKVAGEEFNMQQSPDGKVSVHLKDGTPLYADGKVNLNVDSRLRFRLSQIPGNIEEIKSKIKQQLSAQQVPKKQAESLEFSR